MTYVLLQRAGDTPPPGPMASEAKLLPVLDDDDQDELQQPDMLPLTRVTALRAAEDDVTKSSQGEANETLFVIVQYYSCHWTPRRSGRIFRHLRRKIQSSRSLLPTTVTGVLDLRSHDRFQVNSSFSFVLS